MRILVVDDEIVSRMKMKKIMDGIGECSIAANGEQALAKFQKALDSGMPFDLITLDVVMPEMDGTQALHEIRQIEIQKQIPKENRVKILMVTSQSDKETVKACIQSECDDYILKPFNKERIMEKLQRVKVI
jgi:two-component system chemotaxis response regulator CheY